MRGGVRASWAFGLFARHPPPACCWPGQSDIAIEPKAPDQHNWPMVLGHTLVLSPGRFNRLAKVIESMADTFVQLFSAALVCSHDPYVRLDRNFHCHQEGDIE